MPLPKGFIKNIKLTKPKVGFPRRQEWLDGIDNQGTFLPRGVLYEDMDKSFVDFVDKDLELVIDGEKVPVIFLTIQRWAEFSKTWQHSDKYKDITLPFITIVRKPDVQVGTNQAGNWNIPQGMRTYTYVKVPTWENGRKGVDIYKIPQPTSVDVSYEVRLFCNKMRDLNKFNKDVQLTFQARQHFVTPNGHPMPVHLETIGDESSVDDFENRRFYVQLFDMKLLGYILDESTFEVVPAVNRALVVEEITEGTIRPRIKVTTDEVNNLVNYSFIFKPRAESRVTFEAEFDIKFTNVTNVVDITNIDIKVNGTSVTTPFVVSAGDSIFIDVTKDFNKTGSFLLTGNLI
jgi:hypothetical protein